MRRQEVEEARIDAVVVGRTQLGVAPHRGEEAHRAIRVEAGARRNADADAVGLELLRAREAGERNFGARQRHRAHLRIVEHVGGDLAHQRGLAHLILADRRMARDHVRHLVAQHRGEFGGVVGEREQAARDVELTVRQREGVDRRRVEDRDLVFQVRPLGCGDELVDGLRDQPFEPGIVIGAAIGGEDAASARAAAGQWRAVVGGLRRVRQAHRRRADAPHVGAAGNKQREKRRRDQPTCRKSRHSPCEVQPSALSSPRPRSARDVPRPPTGRPVALPIPESVRAALPASSAPARPP